MRRSRNAKIVATLGPSSSDPATVRALFAAGVDVFRLNFSHGNAEEHRQRARTLREVEAETGRPISVLADLQGPKLRVGTFADGPIRLEPGRNFRLDMDSAPGDTSRVSLQHPEIFAAVRPGTELLLDDGRVRLVVEEHGPHHALTRIVVGGALSERKGVSIPTAVLPLSALTAKDRLDLNTALEIGVDWIALSFVQRPEDVSELKALVDGRAWVMSKLEKPAAIDCLEEIVTLSDAVMVARGDLGVEMPAEQVPSIQKRIIQCCRRLGRPVVVATQMLESMVDSPTPTRAEASDVATAIYEGADAVMLSAESATGAYPIDAVRMMDKIIGEVEKDTMYRDLVEASHSAPSTEDAAIDATDAVCCAMRRVVSLLDAAATVTYTSSGHTSLRAARERPESPILSLTPNLDVARRLALVWGLHSIQATDVQDAQEMVDCASATAVVQKFTAAGQVIIIIAGMPFKVPGATNLLRIATI